MSLVRKFIIVLILSIFIVAILNIVAFYVLYTNFLRVYLGEKMENKNSITIEYINDIMKKQTESEIDNLFSDSEIEFFELLEINKGKIPLNRQKNREIVVNYLVKSGLSTKYIEELIPSDNLSKILTNIKTKNSPEYNFIKKLTWGILLTNIVTIIFLIIFIGYFIRKTVLPIKEATSKIKKLRPGKENSIIKYNKKDEVGLLISSINGLNKRLNVQKNIRSRLLADISHELKTPITSIGCYLEGITDGVIKLDKKNLGAITDEMKRLISLVNRIMKYEKFENQKLELEVGYHNIYDLIKQIAETNKKILKENKQKIKLVGSKNKEIQLDRNLFNQVIHNILSNFLKYAGRNTILTINITNNYIDFFDNGKGVKKSEIPFLIEKFYQADKQKSGDVEKRGIGVGLSLVDKIIEKHSWNYEIKSDTNKGFRLKVFF